MPAVGPPRSPTAVVDPISRTVPRGTVRNVNAVLTIIIGVDATGNARGYRNEGTYDGLSNCPKRCCCCYRTPISVFSLAAAIAEPITPLSQKRGDCATRDNGTPAAAAAVRGIVHTGRRTWWGTCENCAAAAARPARSVVVGGGGVRRAAQRSFFTARHRPPPVGRSVPNASATPGRPDGVTTTTPPVAYFRTVELTRYGCKMPERGFFLRLFVLTRRFLNFFRRQIPSIRSYIFHLTAEITIPTCGRFTMASVNVLT